MNNFARLPSMERRQAVHLGSSPPGRQQNMANSFASRSNFGGGQPRIEGDFLSESGDNYGSSQLAVGKQNSLFGGFQPQRPPTQQSVSGFDPYGNRPNTGGFGRGSGGFGNQGLGATQNMSRTQTGGFGMQNKNASNLSIPSYQGGRAGGGGLRQGGFGQNQPYQQQQDGGGMQRYGSQQSLAYSQNSYGEQNQYGGGRGRGNQPQFVKTATGGQLGGFRQPGPAGSMRQGSLASIKQATIGNARAFGQSFYSRPQQSSGQGFYNELRDRVMGQYQQNMYFKQLVDHLGNVINQQKRQNQMQTPAEFFKDYDAYQGRVFEEWELEIMFGLQQGEVSILTEICGDETGAVSIGNLFECLQISVENLNINEVNRAIKSAWEEKRKRLDKRQLDLYLELADLIKQQYCQGEISYFEAFFSIQYSRNNGAPPEQFMHSDILVDAILDHRGDVQNQMYDFLNYICLGRNTDIISQIHFVRALQVLSPDNVARNASPAPENIGRGSVDRLTGISGFDPTTLNEMLLKIPERPQSQKIDPLVQKLADHLQASGDIGKLEKSFPLAKKMLIKTTLGQVREVQCAKKSELETFLRSQIDIQTKKPLLDKDQIDTIVRLYQAEQPSMQVGVAASTELLQPPAPVLNDQSKSIADAIPEEPAAGEEEQKVEEEQMVKAEESPLKRNDTEFDRDVSADRSGELENDKSKEVEVEQDKITEKKQAIIDERPIRKLATPPAELVDGDEEQKEGEDDEYYEGGEVDWINLEKLKNDVKEATNLTRQTAKDLIIQIFQRIKKWVTLTTRQIKLLFRNQDKKLKKIVSKKQLYNVLSKVTFPFNLTNQHIVAILTVIGDVQNEILNYERFCTVFYDFANEKQIKDNDPLARAIENIKEFAEKKSLVSLLAVQVDSQKARTDPDYRYEIPFKLMTQKISRHHGKVFIMDAQTEALLESKIVLDKERGQADLVALQELIGFEDQHLIDVQGGVYRRIAMELQLNMMTIELVREGTIGRSRGRAMMSQDQMIQNWYSQVCQYKSDEEANDLQGIMQEYADGNQYAVNAEKFIGRIEREMTKFAMIQRFYLRIIKIIEEKKKQKEGRDDLEDMHEFLISKGLNPETNQIDIGTFKEMLRDMDLIGSQDENWAYFQEDFDADEEGSIAYEKFEEDYKVLIPHIEDLIHKIFGMMDSFCKKEYQKRSLKEELMNVQRINQIHLMNAREGQKSQVLWLHSFDFQRWFQTVVIPFAFNDQYSAKYDREVLNVFTLYMSRSEKQKNLIYVPYLLQKYMDNFSDPKVEQELSQESLSILVKYVCKVLDNQNQFPEEHFQNAMISKRDFVDKLDHEPFKTSMVCDLPTNLSSVINYSRQIHDPSGNFIDVSKFKELLLLHIEKLTMRSRELLNIKRVLDERGEKIENVIQTIKCTNDMIDDLGIELVDLAQLCHLTGVKLDIATQLEPIMDTFDRNLYGEVAAVDFIYAYNNAHFGIFEEGGDDVQVPVVNAKRYFQQVDQVIDQICIEIDERNLTDFGSFLKGNDLFYEGKIKHHCFFQILSKVFDELVGEGDILDVIKFFDPTNTGTIFIRDVQKTFNAKIKNRQNRIKLVSWVDTCVEENIVEPTSPRTKTTKTQAQDEEMPAHYKKQMLMDIHCGAINKSECDLYNWFVQYGLFKPNQLSKSEFVIALDRLGVESEIQEKEDVFAYVLKRIATKQDKLTDFHKKPIAQQSLQVKDLSEILNEDMPGVSPSTMQDRILRIIAQSLTEQKLPVIDILKKYEDARNPGLIDTNTFAINVLENEFKLKEQLTRNMINVIINKYVQGSTMIQYDHFIFDLESLEQMNRATIRVFKTQAEINFFMSQAVGGEVDIEAESYRRNRILVEPIKEPVYESQTSKNTYYFPPPEDLLSNHETTGPMLNSFMMMEGAVNISFQGGNTTSIARPMLTQAQHRRIDEIIISTRRLGSSVEGYFQRFGKFSTQDGIRKIDCNQFRDAIGNLDGMQWAKDKPYLMTELFDDIIIAFENYNTRTQMNQTVLSGNSAESRVKDADADQGAPRLTLEQIGQIVYHNSSVDLEKMEAAVLTELHQVLFNKGLVDKLQDMVTFMNWERDSSCTIDQFKSLLLETMKVGTHITEERLEILLQRYRQDSYELAKIQRNELATINADRLDVIKRGFSNVGKQKIQILGLYHDLGYQQRKIGIEDQWASSVAESIIKVYQVKLVQEGSLAMSDSDVDSQMHQFVLRMCMTTQEQFTYTDFSYMMTSLQMWDGQVHSRGKLEDFYKICQREELADATYFAPNRMDLQSLVIPQFIPTQQYVKAFEFLARKPLSFMYQEVIDKFYVISKRQHISISGPTIMHLFDYDDIEETGFIQLENFVYRIQEFLQRKRFRSSSIVTNDIGEHDLRFLATKYIQRNNSAMIHYVSFIDDYDAIEKMGLGAGINQLSLKSRSVKRDTALKSLAGANTWRVKTLSELTPPESKTIYEKMGSYIQKRHLTESLCLSLVNADQTRDGFLERRDLGDILAKLGMKVSSKQLTLLLQVLAMNHKQQYSYLEMIALLFGESVMHKTMQENNIEFGDTDKKPKKIDMSLLRMSDSLKDQIELKLNLLQSQVAQITRGSSLIRDQELFKILKDAEIVSDMADIDTLEQYLTFQRNKENNTINFRVFLEHFQILPHTSNLLSEIIVQLSEKKVVLEEITSQRRFTFNEFQELLTRIGVKIAGSKVPTLLKLFEQMSERHEELSRATMIKCLGSQFTNVGKPTNLQRRSTRTLPEPPYPVNAFLTFLINKGLNLRVPELKAFLNLKKYQVSQGDFEVIVMFFSPPGAQPTSARSGQKSQRQSMKRQSTQKETEKQSEQGMLDLGKMIVYARRIDPNYAKDEASENPGVVAPGARKTVLASFPQKIKQILKRLSDYMIDNQLTKEALFQELDTNGDSFITQNELVRFSTNNKIIEGLAQEDVCKLFTFLDSNNNGSISINELCLLLQSVTHSTEARMASFSFEFEAALKSDIEELFDRLDTDHNKALTATELFQMIRPTDSQGSITLEKAYDIIRQFDSDGDARISKPEFVSYIMPRQKRQILDFEDHMEDLRKLFKEQVAQGMTSEPTDSQLDILNKNQFISKDGLRNLIIKAGHKAVTQAEIDAIFAETDQDQNGTIDIDEFMTFVQVADRVKTKNQLARDSVFNIRKARLKLNQLDLLEMFVRMPLSFLPSFSMQEIEQRKNHLPIHGIQFHFNHHTMSYTGLEKIKDLRAKYDQPKLYIAQYKPKVGFEISLTDQVFNVPLIKKLAEDGDLPHCEVRCFLFDIAQKVYLSNFYILGAEAIRKAPQKGKQGLEPQVSANWRYDPNLSSFFLTSDQQENPNVNLVVEFVIYGNNARAIDPKDRKDKGNQVTVAWTNIPIQKLSTTNKHKLELKGGNPFKEQEIITTEDTDKPTQNKSFLKKIFGGGSDTSKVTRYLNLEAKPFSKLPEQVQLELSSLPSFSSCLVCKPLLSLAVVFRHHCYLLLTKHEQEMTQPDLDIVMVQFPKIYNSPDFISALAVCWPAAVQNTAGGVVSQEKLEKLKLFVRMIYSVMSEPNVKLDHVYPTRSSPLNQKLYRSRQIALKSVLMATDSVFMAKVRTEILADNELSANTDDATIQPQDGETLFMEDYVPFTMGEICGNFDGFDGDEAIAGLLVDQEKAVNQMERRYAADGLYI